MRAKELINENGKLGNVPNSHNKSQPGAYKFRDNGFDRIYHLNQIMKAAAMADGSLNEINMDDESFVGKHNMAYPYSELEHKMMQQAFKTVRANHAEALIKNHKSQEPDYINKISPVTGFKGYK